MKKVSSHPGLDAVAIKGKVHPGFEKAAAHEERVNRGVPPQTGSVRKPIEADSEGDDMPGSPGGC
jgi:hypothetical protein